MESAAISGARWVVGKALSPLSDGLVEAWAATSELGPNIEALKMELLYAQAMLNNARGREIHNPALAELLQRLRGLAYGAEDVLDELDYFRIQDELEGTFETVDDRGCARNLVRDARHTAKAAGKQIQCASCFTPGARAVDGVPYEQGEQGARRRGLLCGAWPGGAGAGAEEEPSCKCVHGLASRARTTAHAVGKRFLCSSLPTVRSDDQVDDGGGQHSSTNKNGKQVICGACSCACMAPWKKQAPKTPMLGFDRVEISRKMKYIVEQLQPICAKVSTVLELEFLSSSRSTGHGTSTGRPITISESTEPKLYGRDPEKNTIIQDITNGGSSRTDLTVIPIVGPGGIGKTTFTQDIYNNQKVQDHFQIRVWICVSLDFNVSKLTQEIARTIPRAEDEKNDGAIDVLQSLDQLQKLIEKRLKNRRFLLVLDDIWTKYGNKNEWEKLLVPFTKGQVKGNIILLTSRFLEVAEMVKANNKVIRLDRLKREEFWDFFLACVFGHGEAKQLSENSGLISIGKQIVDKLKGSPLAAKTVGRLLRNNLTPGYWIRVLESKEWESQTQDDDIMPALKLSYDYLPFHLQQCFFYCALFPEDYPFGSEELICFWIGLGILRPGHAAKITIEDIGLEYLNELVNYGFLKKEIYERGTRYVIHDLLHDLAVKVSSQECLHIASSSARSVEIPPSIYHLSISMSVANGEDGIIQESFQKEIFQKRNRMKFENLHTLMLFGEYDAKLVSTFSDLLRDAKSLRLVYLQRVSHPVEFILHNFSKLVHLRYLRLASTYDDRKLHLPSGLSRFYHLRVLDIARWSGSHNLPRDMSNLVNLRHFLGQYGVSIPNVGKMHCLQELRGFQVKKENNGFELRELGQLAELRGSLDICNLENVLVNEVHEAKLPYKNRLEKVTLNWKKDRSNKNPDKEDHVLENLCPHNNLHELCIIGHGGLKCPTWLGTNLSIKRLEALHLDGVAWNLFPSIGEMWLINESGEEYFGCTTGPNFQNLKRLELVGLPKFRRWVANEVCPMFFSLIEVLIVKGCPELTELPFSYYTCHQSEGDGRATWFPRLRNIEIQYCPKLSSLPPIPYTDTLCSVDISGVGSGLETLNYSNQPSSLRITGNETLHSLDDTVLAFHNLNQLQKLKITKCPSLAEKHLQMLTSLKKLEIYDSSNVFLPSASSDVKWKIPVKGLDLWRCGASGKELTQLLSHLPELSELWIMDCEKITLLGVESEQQETAAPISLPSASAVKMEDAQATDQHQQIAGEVVEEEVAVELVAEQEEEDGLLLIPTHLSDPLQELMIGGCSELSLMASPTLPDGHNKIGGRGGEGGGLQALHSLQKLDIGGSPKFLSAYKTSSVCPFPSSLRCLILWNMEGTETFEPLSNLTSLTELGIAGCGEDLRWEGLWPLHTQGQLSGLFVRRSPKFFVGSDPVRGLQDEEEQQLLPSSFKLRELDTDDVAGALVVPVCSLLSSFLTKLTFFQDKEVVRFTKEQDEALQLLTSLQELEFTWCEKLQCLPAGLNKLTNLKALQIFLCKELQCLPAGLNKLTNLKALQIQSCPSLRSLPKDGLPSSLQELDVRHCDNEKLKQKCRRFTGTIPKIIL